MKPIALLSAAVATWIAVAMPASAVPLNFTITGDYDASFVLDSNPVPGEAYADDHFTVFDVDGLADSMTGLADVSFYHLDQMGGLQIYDFYGTNVLLATSGVQLYTGPEAAPSFVTGKFDLAGMSGTGSYSLTITDPAAPSVPEPATWAMFIGGFGLVGGAMRRRARTSVRFA